MHGRQDRRGQQLFCELPDDTLCALPAWMFDPASADYALGSPLIALDALVALRALLDARTCVEDGGHASSLGSAAEGIDEATRTPREQSTASAITDVPSSTIPHERQVELIRLLTELLITAIPPRVAIDSERGRHAAEADR